MSVSSFGSFLKLIKVTVQCTKTWVSPRRRPWDRIGGLIQVDAAYDRLQEDNHWVRTLSSELTDSEHRCVTLHYLHSRRRLSFAGACAWGRCLDWKAILERQRWLKVMCVSIKSDYLVSCLWKRWSWIMKIVALLLFIANKLPFIANK